jgi:hypothetical protein
MIKSLLSLKCGSAIPKSSFGTYGVPVRLTQFYITYISYIYVARGGAVIEALGYKPESRGFDSRWCHWNLSLT